MTDIDARKARLDEPHVRPLMDLVRAMRARGLSVPNVDPDDGGVNARVLFYLETPSPQAVNSGFVSRENPDYSAKNIGSELSSAGFARSDVLLWNVVPHCVSSADQNRNVTIAQIRGSISDSQTFVDSLPNLAVAVFCGRQAQRAVPLLHFLPKVCVLSTYHPGAQAYNHTKYRTHIRATFEQAHRLISS